MILVQILKQEWPKNWPTFISGEFYSLSLYKSCYNLFLDICGASKTSESLCKNNMIILKLLSEEVFEFSTDQMTKAKIQHLKKSMSSEFSNVFELCMFVLVSNHFDIHYYNKCSHKIRSRDVIIWFVSIQKLRVHFRIAQIMPHFSLPLWKHFFVSAIGFQWVSWWRWVIFHVSFLSRVCVPKLDLCSNHYL